MAGRAASRWGVTALLCLLAGWAVTAPPASADERVGTEKLISGSLTATVEADPFRIEFRDAASGKVLRTLAGAAGAPTEANGRYGAPGYSFDLRIPVLNNAFLGYYVGLDIETLWFHGTRVLGAARSGDALVLDVATNDPLGHRLEVTLTPDAPGSIRVASRIKPGSGPFASLASISGVSFEAESGERFLGFGERSNAVDQTGNKVINWAEEGPFSSGVGEDFLRPLLPDFTFPTGPTTTNFPIPWALSTRGFGVLLDQTERSYFRLGSDRADAWHAETEASSLRFSVFGGPTPADVVRRYSDRAGRQPDPAPWIFGPWFQPTREARPYELADRFRAEDVPVSVAQTYTHYLPCGAQEGKTDAERARTAGYHQRGYKITTYFNPHICTSYEEPYNEASANGYLVKNAAGNPYLVTNPFTADGLVSEVDFTDPGARQFYAGRLDEAIDNGYDGWMEDFGEYTPTDSVFSDGRGGREMHNRYPVEYHCTSYDHTRGRMGRDAAVFIRSGYHGVQPCARVVWGGDPTEDWSCADGLCAAVHQALSMGLSGISYWGTDIGGFHALVNSRTDHELNIRWLQFGAFNGVMRTQANGLGLPTTPGTRSEVWDPEVLPIWRRFTKLRTQLYPYIEAASEAYQQTGMPLDRHLALAYPDDPEAVARQDQFMFGPDLLAAPVIEEGATERSLYLPAGRWVDLWRTLSFDEATGAFPVTEHAALLEGGREVTLPAPIEQMPLLAKAGALIPMLPSDVDTLTADGADPGIVNLGERNGTVELLAFPRGSSSAGLPGGERISSSEVAAPGANLSSVTHAKRKRPRKGRRKGKGRKVKKTTTTITTKRDAGRAWSLDFQGSPGHLYRLQASLATLEVPFTPCELRLDGQVLPASTWTYDGGAAVLRASFKLQGSGQLVAREKCETTTSSVVKSKKRKRQKRREKRR